MKFHGGVNTVVKSVTHLDLEHPVTQVCHCVVVWYYFDHLKLACFKLAFGKVQQRVLRLGNDVAKPIQQLKFKELCVSN